MDDQKDEAGSWGIPWAWIIGVLVAIKIYFFRM